MGFFMKFVLLFFLTAAISGAVTSLYRRLALKMQLVDRPSARKIHDHPIPTMGGIAVFLTFWGVYFFVLPERVHLPDIGSIFTASSVILVTGIVDDQVELKPWQKMIGILLAANIVYFFTSITIDSLTIDWIGTIAFRDWSYLVMMLWIAAVTNASNLMDGLDGLAAGTSVISLATMGLVSYFFAGTGNVAIAAAVFLLMASLCGFLPLNFHPARIFLGDTGSLFIGFMIAVFSLNGLKHATFFALLVPVAIMGVPLTDTVAAILRRLLHKRPISSKDTGHLHHRLLLMGFTHRQTVLVIYALSIIFSLTALLYPLSDFWGAVALTVGLLFGTVLFILSFNLLDRNRSRVFSFVSHLFRKSRDGKNI